MSIRVNGRKGRWGAFRAPEEVALAELRAELPEHGGLLCRLDASATTVAPVRPAKPTIAPTSAWRTRTWSSFTTWGRTEGDQGHEAGRAGRATAFTIP